LTAKPTEEEIEAARQIVAQADAEKAEAARLANLAAVEALTEIGLGTEDPIGVSVPEFIQAIQGQVASAASASDTTLLNLFTATANCLRTLNDRVRTIVAQNQPPPAE
jgi:hypothetical protein